MGLVPPPKVEKLQAALHTKAKEAPDYRFYALYDKLYRKDILQHAFKRCLANQGVAGVDGVTFEWIEGYGEERWLDELAEELRQQTYRTQPVRRVNIPKEGQLRVITIIDGLSIEIIDGTSSIRRVLRVPVASFSCLFSLLQTATALQPHDARGDPHQRRIQGTSRPRRRQRSTAA